MRSHEAGALHAEGYGGPPLYLPYPDDVMALLPQLWPESVGRDDEGRLTVAGLDVASIARDFGTAAYVIDEGDFRARAQFGNWLKDLTTEQYQAIYRDPIYPKNLYLDRAPYDHAEYRREVTEKQIELLHSRDVWRRPDRS